MFPSQYVLESYITRPMDTQASFVFWKCIWGFAIPFFVWVSRIVSRRARIPDGHGNAMISMLISVCLLTSIRNGVKNRLSPWNTLYKGFWRPAWVSCYAQA
jgi:hypothetical protein